MMVDSVKVPAQKVDAAMKTLFDGLKEEFIRRMNEDNSLRVSIEYDGKDSINVYWGDAQNS